MINRLFTPEIGGALLHFAEVGVVPRLVHEELIHVLDRMIP